jgi:transcriptional regulator GlxA family with amidase domain
MQIAFIIFNGLTALDFVGIYDPLTRLKRYGFIPDLAWDICALQSEVRDDRGLQLAPSRLGGELGGYDLLVVPGGDGTRSLQHDPEFITWLRTAAPCRLKVSVCTGSLLLGAAGFLRGRPATTHPSAYAELKPYVDQVVESRIVDTGDVITARGVTSSIDCGLYVVERLAGAAARSLISQKMDYPYSPPPDSLWRSDSSSGY